MARVSDILPYGTWDNNVKDSGNPLLFVEAILPLTF